MLRHNNRFGHPPTLLCRDDNRTFVTQSLSRRKTPLHHSPGPMSEVMCSIGAQSDRQSGMRIGGPRGNQE
jgi:hypothetical protein